MKSQEKTLQSFGIGLYGDREGKDAGESVAQGADEASVTRAIHGVAAATAGFMTVDFFLKRDDIIIRARLFRGFTECKDWKRDRVGLRLAGNEI
jgi:hypothetical protein